MTADLLVAAADRRWPARLAPTDTASQQCTAIVAVVLAFVLVLALCLPFLATGTDVPTAVAVLGCLLPGLASFVAVLLVLGRGHLVSLWRLRPASSREFGASYPLALAVMLPVLVVPAAAV